MPEHAPPTAVLLPVWIVTGAAVLGSLSALSRLVKIQRERHTQAWVADGRPGAPWIVPWRLPPAGDPAMFRGPLDPFKTYWLHMRWLFSTPAWARDDAAALRLLWTLRGLQAVALAGVATWFVLILPHVGRR